MKPQGIDKPLQYLSIVIKNKQNEKSNSKKNLTILVEKFDLKTETVDDFTMKELELTTYEILIIEI